MQNEEIVKTLENMDKAAKAIKEELIQLCWYMRGGLNYSQAMLLGPDDREIINKLIKDNIETTKKTNLPFF